VKASNELAATIAFGQVCASSCETASVHMLVERVKKAQERCWWLADHINMPENRMLMLQDPQASLYHDVLQDASWGNVDGVSFSGDNDNRTLQNNASGQVYVASDGEMIKLENLGDGWDALLEL
jgi:hypothetical protein